MTEQNAITKKEESPLAEFMRRPDVVAKFSGLFPNDRAANRFVQSVLIQVATADPGDCSLQSCSNNSILRAALRAVSLRVSVDPAEKQSFLVPRKNKKTGKLEATLQLHYVEELNKARRSGRYQIINVAPIYDGEEVMQDPFTGLHVIRLKSGVIVAPGAQNGFVPVKERFGKISGWMGYYRESGRSRAEKTVYMSVDDIEKHVTHYNQYWKDSFFWKNSREAMERKTVLRALLSDADKSSMEFDYLEDKDEFDDDDVIETDFIDEVPTQEKSPEDKNAQALQAALDLYGPK